MHCKPKSLVLKCFDSLVFSCQLLCLSECTTKNVNLLIINVFLWLSQLKKTLKHRVYPLSC